MTNVLQKKVGDMTIIEFVLALFLVQIIIMLLFALLGWLLTGVFGGKKKNK